MKPHRLRVARDVEALVRGLHPDIKRKIRAGLDVIRTDPAAGKELRDDLAGLRSLRVGRFRLVYRIAPGEVIEIIAVGPRRSIYEEAEHGAEDVGHLEPERRLSWARLRIKPSEKTIFVATAHLTSRRHADEGATGVSPRVRQLQRIADELTRYVHEGEPAFFMGDMNDAWHPQRILLPAACVGCFAALGMQSPPTFQCYPTASVRPGEPTVTEAIDLIAANKDARAIAASVPQCYAGHFAPSDHWPVQAIYQLVW